MNKSAVLFVLFFLAAGGAAFAQFFGLPRPGYYYPGYYPGFYDQGSTNQAPNIQINNNPSSEPEKPYARLGPSLGTNPVDPNYYTERDARPLFYKPTMRYYGSGYTVSYRYVPVYRADVWAAKISSGASNFPTDSFLLSPEQVDSLGGSLARITLKDNSSSGPRSAVTSIVHKKTTTTRTSTRSKVKDTGAGDNPPAVQPGPAPAPDAPVPPKQ
jgi:hypothetical protein